MKDHRSLLASAVILLSACFDPDYPLNRPCGADGWCPPGQECICQVCRRPVPPDNADLAALSLSVPGLDFAPDTRNYELYVSTLVRSVRVAACPAHRDATLRIAGQTLAAGEPSIPLELEADSKSVDITVTPRDGIPEMYTVNVHVDQELHPDQRVYAKADNAWDNDLFGWRVAIDGDTMAVSAPGEGSCDTGVAPTPSGDHGCPGMGAVYVYRSSGSDSNSDSLLDWQLEAYLKPSQGSAYDEFGIGLALDGDIIVVGAFHADSTRPDSGMAFVFRRAGTSWTEEARLEPQQPQAGQEFGWSVAVAGDLIAVGARREDDDDTMDSGAVYLYHFDREAIKWEDEAWLAASTPENDGFFGYSVAAGDGVVVVGACGEGCPPDGRDDIDDPMKNGNAYVFRQAEAGWTEEINLATLILQSPGLGDAFGFSVALSEDESRVVIGASPKHRRGAAYVFHKGTETWNPEDKLTRSSAEVIDRVGVSVAISGTLVAVGASREDDGTGAVYLYRLMGTTWREQERITASNPDMNDEFGWSVALSDDALVAGAIYEDSSTTGVSEDFNGDDNTRTNTGAVYLFH